MGLGNIVSTVLTKYKADTSDQKKALKGLKGEERKRHLALLKQTEEQNKKIDGQIANYGKAAIAVGVITAGVVAATKALQEGFDTLEKNSRLRAATVGVSLDGLRDSTQGLVDDTRLLEFASGAMNGTFKLTQREMEKALSGAVALRKTLGVDLTTALDRTQKAIVEGSVEPLKELGLVVKDVANDTEEGLNAALSQLSEQAAKTGGDFTVTGDEITRASTSMENAMDSLSESVGRIAVALAPAISAMAKLLEVTLDTSDAIANVDKRSKLQQANDNVKKAELNAANSRFFKKDDLAERERTLKVARSEQSKILTEIFNKEREKLKAARSNNEARDSIRTAAPKKKGGGKRQPDSDFRLDSLPGALSDAADKLLGGLETFRVEGESALRDNKFDSEDRGKELQAQRQETLRLQAEFDREQFQRAEELLQMAEFAKLERRNNILTDLFGAPAEIDAQTESLAALASTFDGFAGAFGAGVGALIDGSASFSEAFKNALADTAKSMAIEMSIRALREAALGIAALATGNAASAAVHAKAAAAFGAGAIAAGAGARVLGAGAAAPSAGGGGSVVPVGEAGVGTSSGSAANDQKNTSVFIIGDDIGSNAREREARYRQIARQAGVTFEGDAIING